MQKSSDTNACKHQTLPAQKETSEEKQKQSLLLHTKGQREPRQKLQARVLTRQKTQSQHFLAHKTTPTRQQDMEAMSNDTRKLLKARIVARMYEPISETDMNADHTRTQNKNQRSSYKCSKCHKIKKMHCICKKIKNNVSLFDTIYKANLHPSAFKLVSDSHVARESHLMLQRKSHWHDCKRFGFLSFSSSPVIKHKYCIGFGASFNKSMQKTVSISTANTTIKKKKYIKTHARCLTTLWQTDDYAKHAVHGGGVLICCLQKHPHYLRWQLQLVCAARSVAAKSVGLYHE